MPPIAALCIKNAGAKQREEKNIKSALKAIEAVTRAIMNEKSSDSDVLCRIGSNLIALGELESHERVGLYYIMTAAQMKLKCAADFFTRAPNPPICFSEGKLYEITCLFYISCGKKFLEETKRTRGPAYESIKTLEQLNQQIIQLGRKVDEQTATVRYELGKVLIMAKNLPAVRDIARHYYKQAASGANIEALLWLAEDCMLQMDFEEAIKYYEKAALKRSVEAMWKIAILSSNSGYLKLAKELGSLEAAYILEEAEGNPDIRKNVRDFCHMVGGDVEDSPVKKRRLQN